jgi:hypothetical protein
MDARVSAAPQTVICTLGMHRSGTSLVSRLLNILGVYLGPDDSISLAGEDNPKGYWEHSSFVGLNDEILARFGGRWDDPPALLPFWPLDERLADLRQRASQLLTGHFAGVPLWGWKDPRTCLTLPFWQHLVGPMRYVICIRNPCAVASSLIRRDGMSHERSEQLWLAHAQDSIAFTNGHPRIFVKYEDLMSDWRPQLRRLADFIGVPARADDPGVHEAVDQFLENELCHHRSTLDELIGDQRVSSLTKGFYLATNDGIGAAGHRPLGRLTRLEYSGRAAHQIYGLLLAEVIDSSDRTAAMAAERHGLARQNLEQAARIDALSAQRDRLIDQARAHAETLAALSRENDGRRQMLQEIQVSCAWKVITFSRGLLAALLPVGTRRRGFFNLMLQHLTMRLPSPTRRGGVADPRAR